jgi:hypothetical protein
LKANREHQEQRQRREQQSTDHRPTESGLANALPKIQASSQQIPSARVVLFNRKAISIPDVHSCSLVVVKGVMYDQSH